MKLQLNELVIDKFYYMDDNEYNNYIIKYKGYDYNHIFCEDYYIYFDDIYKCYKCYKYSDYHKDFCDLSFYNRCFIFEEVSIGKFVDCLPVNNLDKKYYLRKEKINFLLENKIIT